MTKSEMIETLGRIEGDPEIRFMLVGEDGGVLQMDSARPCRFIGLVPAGIMVIGEAAQTGAARIVKQMTGKRQEAL